MSVKSEHDSMLNHYPDIVYTLEPTIQHVIRLLRVLRWKKDYTHQSITLTLIWTFFWFHTLIVSYSIPIWMILILYHSVIDGQQPKDKESTINSFEKLTDELKEIQLELSLILPGSESKDRFRQWCRRRSLFVLNQNYYYQLSVFILLYVVWIALLTVLGADKIIWLIGCLFLTWNSPLFKVIRYSYHRAYSIIKPHRKATTEKKLQASITSNHYDRFYRFVVIEHQRWWLHSGWTALLLPNERPEWSDEYLSKVPSIASFHLPPPTTRLDKKTFKVTKISWEWVSQDWQMDENHNVDKDGWEYGSWDWTAWSTKSSGLRVLTRRRYWVRNARLVEEPVSSENTLPISIITKKSNTCASISTSLSSEDSFLCTTPTNGTLLQKSSSSATSKYSVEPSIFSDHSNVETQLWLRR